MGSRVITIVRHLKGNEEVVEFVRDWLCDFNSLTQNEASFESSELGKFFFFISQ